MAKIPEAVAAIGRAQTDPFVLRRILVAAVRRFQEAQPGDDPEPFVLTEDDLREAWNFKLVVHDLGEDGAIVLSVKPR